MRLAAALLTPILFCSTTLGQPLRHRAKISEIPDFLQTDREAGLSRSGSQFCAPTAVSNSLMWLADNGYEDLRSGEGKAAQIAMIRALGSKAHMKTSPVLGTDVAQVIAGVRSYITDAGYTIDELSYEGWRPVPRGVAAGEHPDLDDIKAAIADDQSAVWLNVGWYNYDEESGEYQRIGGHWVTAVGYDGDDFLIHDPSPSAGASFRTQRISLEELSEGELTGNQRNLPRSASGYYEVGGQMAIPDGKTCILDGAVFLRLE